MGLVDEGRLSVAGCEDQQQLEWLVDKLLRELQESKQREQMTASNIQHVSETMNDLNEKVGYLYRENAALRTQLAACSQHELQEDNVLNTNNKDTETGEVFHQLKDWFDDRSKLHSIIEAQQREILTLTTTVRQLAKVAAAARSSGDQP
eukprot:TRINITY_DN25399_c0_g1_i1.p1 TRINITY_DN25399_c0_g1~~TRINITY_DN25399_c0_g1_i1.p1  ORF type:complete len:163 (+),score=58.69 TRINITY_DN25399_c0_g1_i1:44-490(+)